MELKQISHTNLMHEYSKDLANKYTQYRDEFNDLDSQLFEFINRIGIEGKDALDLGCGDGRYTAKLLSMGAKSAKGIDISVSMIELAKNRQKDIEFTLGDCTKLPFADESFDIVFSNFVLQHCQDLKKAFQEIARTLKKNGYFIGTFNAVDTNNHEILNQTMPILLGKENPITVYDLMKSNEEYTAAIKDTELNIIEYLDEPSNSAFIDPKFEHYSKIKKLQSIACLLKK